MKPVHFLCSCFSGTLKKLFVFFLRECLSWWLYLNSWIGEFLVFLMSWTGYLFINFSYKFRIQKIDISMIHINNWFYQDFFWKLHNRTHSTIDFFKERSPQQIDIRKKLIDLIGHVLYLLPTLFSKCCACKLIRIQEVGIRPSG